MAFAAPAPAAIPLKTGKAKTSLNLNGLNKPTAPVAAAEAVDAATLVPDLPVSIENLLEAWAEFTEQRKEQSAEYQFLKREIQFDYPAILVTLTNPVEETLLENFRRDFTQLLRDRLKNSQLTIRAVMQKSTGKKVIYTAREKFEHLAEKNPHLHELKNRLGLDWDF